jgi:hypothetical protein
LRPSFPKFNKEKFMTNQRKPLIPGPIVSVDKGYGRSVSVAIVDTNRMITHGFDVDYPARIHFRTMRHGPFSVLVATKDPVEVRVIMDGKLLSEQRLDPLPTPSRDGSDLSAVRNQVREHINAPQPFFISFANDGSPLTFAADPVEGRTATQRMQLQLHPDLFAPAQGATMHLGKDPVDVGQAKPDIIPSAAHLIAPPAPPAASVEGESASTGDPEVAAELLGTNADTATQTSTAQRPALVVPASAQLPVEQFEAPPSDLKIELPLPKMAPSFGMIVVGVRMVQTQAAGEPVMPADGFEYVLFQANTWEEHCKVRANLHSRIKLPPKMDVPEIDDGTPKESHDHRTHSPHCGCGKSHGYDPRRFR